MMLQPIDNNMNIMVHKPSNKALKVSPSKRRLFQERTQLSSGTNKMVRFALESNHEADTPRSLSPEECNERWYQSNELAVMKLEAKTILQNRHRQPNEKLIGLERFTRQRAAWKKSAIRYVLMAQNFARSKDETPERMEDTIHKVSLRCTEWARNRAEKQGFEDYCAVHDPLASLFSDSLENYNEMFFGVSKDHHKRKLEALPQEQPLDENRRVRQRRSRRPVQ